MPVLFQGTRLVWAQASAGLQAVSSRTLPETHQAYVENGFIFSGDSDVAQEPHLPGPCHGFHGSAQWHQTLLLLLRTLLKQFMGLKYCPRPAWFTTRRRTCGISERRLGPRGAVDTLWHQDNSGHLCTSVSSQLKRLYIRFLIFSRAISFKNFPCLTIMCTLYFPLLLLLSPRGSCQAIKCIKKEETASASS